MNAQSSRGALTSYPSVISLPTPPSTKSTRSRHRPTHNHIDVGLPTPSTSTRKPRSSTTKLDHRASPIVRSRQLGTDGVNLEAETGEDSESSESEADVGDVTLVTEKRWLGRRGTRRAGLTFAQQMGLLVARTSTETHQVPTSEWQSIAEGRSAKEPVDKSFYFNAASVSKRELLLDTERRTATVPDVASGNPFLDDVDLASAPGKAPTILRKTASGRLLDPVDLVIASNSSASFESQIKPHEPSSPLGGVDSLTEDAGSETEKEEMEEEEDDSPYLIEDGTTGNSHAAVSGRVDTLDAAEMDDSAEQLSSAGDMSEVEEDALKSATIKVDEGEISLGTSEPRSEEEHRPSITRYLSAIKSSTSLNDSEKTPSEVPTIPGRHVHRRQRSRSRERKTWGKPILGVEDENPFLASSSIGKPKGASDSSSWLRTDNARARRSEGEKPTIDYLL